MQNLPEVSSVLEVGPGLGLVSAMLHNAGFSVTTFDRLPPQYVHDEIKGVQDEILQFDEEKLVDFDCILCCETLEHLYWDEVDIVLEKFFRSKIRWVIISVPYQEFQLDFRFYFNKYRVRQSVSLKLLKWMQKFKFDSQADPYGHKWEIGYRGTKLRAFETKLTKAGFHIRRREFTSPTRSVFFMLENTG